MKKLMLLVQCGFNRDFKTRRDVAEYSAGIAASVQPEFVESEPFGEQRPAA